MDAQTVRTALGTLQTNPDAAEAWESLRAGLSPGDGDLDPANALRLMQAARERHDSRGEAEAVARLLEFSIELSAGTTEEPLLLRELSRVLLEDLFDSVGAMRALARAAAAAAGEGEFQDELDALQAKGARYSEQAATYISEAEAASDDAYQSAMLMRAAEVEVSFSQEPRLGSVIENLERAVRLDPGNLLAAKLLEVVFRREGRFEDAARTLERVSERAADTDARVTAGVRLARLAQYRLGDEARAAAAYDRVLEISPSQPDAMEFVTDFYAQNERWDDLVRVYERPLKTATTDVNRLGDMLQVAMLHWKKREVPADAEPWFARIRKLDPAHDGVLAFYRSYKAALEDDAGLVLVLQDAQRALPEGDSRAAEIATDLARYAESQANAHRAIEQYKSVLRADAENVEARTQLKSLYKQTLGHNALVELLRQDLERTAEADLEKRLEILREIALVYREYLKSETALVGVLNQIVQLDGKLDEHDVGEVRELVGLYERLGRHRDLLASKKLLAEIVPDVDEKKALYRQIGRLWLDQFSNVQHAMEAYAALHELDPTDQEAIERLDELYRKRRAWKELYSLYEEQLQAKQGQARVPILREMAQLAAERLGRTDDALSVYREILEIDPSRADVLDRMEKHAERAKSWSVLADVLEKRLSQMPEDETRLPVLQKLGSVYADQLDDAERAIGTWRRVVDAQPGNARAMRVLRDTYLKADRFDELEELYGGQGDLEGLAEVLSTAADRAADPKAKIDLSYRAARVYEEKLGQAARAIRSYERILSLEARDARAIERLLPLYEQEEKWARVPVLLETLIELSETPEEKVTVLGRLVHVTGQRLADKRNATAHARRAFEIAPQDPRAIELLDATSRNAGSWDEMVHALEVRLGALGDSPTPERGTAPPPAFDEPQTSTGRKKKRGKKASGGVEPTETPALPRAEPVSEEAGQSAERRAVRLRLARVLGEELGQVAPALERLKALGVEHPSDPEILGVFKNLLGRENRPDDVRWLYAHRAEFAANPAEKGEVLAEAAAYEDTTTGDRARALGLYKLALAQNAEQVVVLEALARLGLSEGEPEVAADALERYRDLSFGAERASKEATLAELYADHLGRHADALAAAQRALGEGVEPGRVIPVLSRLVEVSEVRGEAARMLSEQYQAGGNSRQEADALRALISETADADERAALYERLSSVYEDKLTEPGGALSVILEALKSFPARPELWDRAEKLAQSSGRPTDLAEAFKTALRAELPADFAADLCRRAAHHHEAVLGDSAGAVPYFEKLLSLEPDDDAAFQRLKQILTGAERWRELEELYDKEIQRLDDDSRRVEMLAEVALLAEEIMGDAERAVTYHRRILELDPVLSLSLEALDRLYTRLGKSQELVDLLDKRVEFSVGSEQGAFLVRIGQLALGLHDPERSITAIERVLVEDPTSYEARDVAEELLKVGGVRMRAARALESVYEARDEIRDLVRVLGVRVEGLRPSEEGAVEDKESEEERRDLLRRIATLRNDRLHDDEGSFDVFAELAPLDPLDADLRDRLIDSGRRLGKSPQVVEVLLAAAKQAEHAALRAEILMQAATIQGGILNDQPAAETTYASVLELSAEEPDLALTAARALETLYVAERRNNELAKNLQFQISIEPDFDRKRELLGRLAHLSSDVLGDAVGAMTAWEARLEETSDDPAALLALTDLYEQAGRYQDLARVVSDRRDAAVRDADRLNLSRKLAGIQELRLGETSLAIDSYQSISDEVGPDPEILDALSRLYLKAERHLELAEVYERQSEVLEQESDRLAALANLGRVRSTHLGDLPGALEAYRRSLALDMDQPESRAALALLLNHEDVVTRLEAAEILTPILDAEGDYEGLLGVLEVQAQSSDDPAFQIERLTTAVEIAERQLNDPKRALGYAVRGTRLAAGQGDVRPWLEALERLAPLANARRAQVEILESIAPELFDADQQLELQKRVAALQRTELGDTNAAVVSYNRALELRADDRESLIALEELYEQADKHRDLLSILERREESAGDDAERKQLLFRRASLLASSLSEPARAIETYESILDLDLDPSAISALERLYATAERYDDLVALIQRRLDEGHENRVLLRVKLARVLSENQKEYERALDELAEALGEESQNSQAISLLEELTRGSALDVNLKGRAAGLLEPVYMARGDYVPVLAALEMRRAGSEDPSERREFITRIAQIHEEQRDDYAAALETTALLLAEDPDDNASIGEMERLAKVAGAELRLAELLSAQVEKTGVVDDSSAALARRAGEIFAARGKNREALPLLEQALAFTPDSDELFRAVDRVLTLAGTPEKRVALYRAALEQKFDPSERLPLLHVVAELEERALGQVESAIVAYQQALEADERDTVSLDALTRLYRQTERWDELAELYQARADDASGSTRAQYRLALASLYDRELGRPDAGLDQLEEIVRETPDHPEAIARIEALRGSDGLKGRAVEILRPLYEATDDWKRLIKLNEDRFALASDPHERVAILRETARLWETRGDATDRARRVLSEAFKLLPEDEEIREEIERLVGITGEWLVLSELYGGVLEEHPNLSTRREIVARLAELFDERLDDPRAALDRFIELFDLESSDLEAVVAMERLALLLADWRVLEKGLVAHADLVFDDDERRDVLVRLGALRQRILDDAPGAVEAYERAFEVDAENTDVADRLISLYEVGDNAGRLVELYLARVELSQDSELSYGLLMRAAQLFEKNLSDRARAIESLDSALSARPGDGKAIAELNRLYREEQMWPELLDNLRLDASTAETAERRLAIRHEVSRILAEKLESFEEALESYGAILAETPADVEALDAVFALADREEHLRQQAADLLVPALRQTSHKPRLVRALDLRLSVETVPADRATTLRAIAHVQEHELSQPKQAFQAFLLAIVETPEAVDLYGEIERLAPRVDGWKAAADALRQRAEESYEPELARDLWVRLAGILETQLGKKAEAVDAYQKATEQVGDQLELLEALDRLYTELGETAQVVELLERRMALADSDEAQSKLLTRQGQLQLDQQKRPSESLASLRQALERDVQNLEASTILARLLDTPDYFDEAFDVLDSVYRERPDGRSLAALHERRVARATTPGERIDMRRSLARVLEEDTQDPLAAQRVLTDGLTDDPSDGGLLDEIERLLAITNAHGEGAQALLVVVGSAKKIDAQVARELSQKAAGWLQNNVGDSAGTEKALALGLQFVPDADDLLEQLESLQSAPGRESDLLATLQKRAPLALDDGTRIEILKRAKQLADKLERREVAEKLLRQVLELDDSDLEALEGLSFLRKAAGDDAETFELLVKRADVEADGDKVRTLRFEAAELARDKLKRVPEAIELLEQLFDDEPDDARVALGLRQAYESAGRFEDLGRLIERLMDLAQDPTEAKDLKISLARLNQDRFDDTNRAADLLEEVVADHPLDNDASARLTDLYEKAGKHDELASLLERQADAKQAAGDATGAAVLLERLADLQEKQLGRPDDAISTWQTIFDRTGKLEALQALYALQLAAGEQQKAAEILEQICEKSSGSAAVEKRLELVELYKKLGEDGRALSALEAVVALDPERTDLRKRLRQEYETAESWSQVAALIVGDADRAKAKNAQVDLLREAAGIFRKKQNDPGAAAELLSRGAALAPDDRSLSLELCDAYSESGRGAEAALVLQKIVDGYGGKRVKELAEIHSRLATAYLSMNDPARAVEELDKAFRIEPGNIAILKQLGEVALDMGDHKKAMQMFRALLLQRLDDGLVVTKAEVFWRLGQIHQAVDEAPKAKQMFERAVQADPTFAPAKDALAGL